MSAWTKQKLDQMIADNVEESLTVEYKRADALAKADGKKAEITKDVSAMANSSGGVVIYGMAETSDKAKKHLPERLDPVCRTDFSKEWLEQIIQTVQPRIDGVVIHPVDIDTQANHVCYVVEVPQSHTAHQARDRLYYKRHNFIVLPMEDYEIRDVMNRKTHPKIRASIFINRNADKARGDGVILVKLENIGRVLAHHYMVELLVPADMGGSVAIDQPVNWHSTDDGDYLRLRLINMISQPLFVDSDITLSRAFKTNIRILMKDRKFPKAAPHVIISVFADEMPPIRATLNIKPVLSGWTPVA